MPHSLTWRLSEAVPTRALADGGPRAALLSMRVGDDDTIANRDEHFPRERAVELDGKGATGPRPIALTPWL